MTVMRTVALLTAVALTAGAAAGEETTTYNVLYLYGSVAADGTIPAPAGQAFHQMRLDDAGPLGMSQFHAALEDDSAPLMQAANARFDVSQAYDADTELTSQLLADVDVLILGSNNKSFSTAEAEAVDDWVRAGGGLVAWSDSAFGGDHQIVGVGNPVGRDSNNRLTEQFGMFFLRDNGAGNYAVGQWSRAHYLNDDQADEGVVFRGEGVSPVRVSGPAEMLAPLQSGDLGGDLRLHSKDASDPEVGPYDPDTDAAVAIAQIGWGRVVGTFDRNTFWNAGAGTQLSHVDNREYAQRLVLWASGAADPIPEPATLSLLAGAAAVLLRFRLR